MRSTLRAILRAASLVGASLLLTTSISSAADVYLQAQRFDKPLPGGTTVPMWGFAQCTLPDFSDCAAPGATDAPGPRITIAPTDSLTIHLRNTLSTPVSLVIPGLPGGGDPVMVTDARGRSRVRSFTQEADPNGGTADYTWSAGALRPGTFLYHSGTHPSIQVPMGLYGALVVGPAALSMGSCATGQPAYDSAGSCHDAEAVLLFSEIDPVQNAAADAASDPTAYPGTVDYSPRYFLINGAPYDRTSPPAVMAAGDPGNKVLLRLLNAGLKSHAPTIVGLDLGSIAEDGNPYPGLAREQSTALLPAGKTLDAIVAMPAADATYPIFDRMLDLTNDNQPDGGMLAYLQVGTGTPAPPPPGTYAVNDAYDVTEDMPLIGAASVLVNDIGLSGATVTVVTSPSNGTLVLNSATGEFDYTPNQDFSGADGFTYSASLSGSSYPAQVTLNVSFVNDPPVASDDGPYSNAVGTAIAVDAAHGVLGNDADQDGDALTAQWVSGSPVTLHPDGSFEYSGASGAFTYAVWDGQAYSAPATVTLEINPISNITLEVADPGGVPVESYRWMVQEDATYHIDPAAPPANGDTLSTNFHRSHMPLVGQGCVGAECAADNESIPVVPFNDAVLDPAKFYYVSVLPNDAGTGVGHSLGGAQIRPGSAGGTVRVVVNNQPIPTSQLSVIAFEDINPTNGVPDPGEPRLGGFQITLEDAGGRYGISGGTMSQDAFGNPLKNSLDCFGDNPPPAGVILTCPDGTALIKDLAPAKIGVVVTPAAGTGPWTQTSTIEGTPLQDNWVKAGEPPFLVEFGAPGYHAFIGFVNPEHTTVPPGPPGQQSNTITGRVTMVHTARPPSQVAYDSDSYVGLSHTRAWVGLNSSAGTGPNIATVQADSDGYFTLNGIPDGTYQLVIWDDYLDQIISYATVIISGDTAVGNVPVNTWFGRHEHNVYLDSNGDGVRQEGEPGLPDKVINLRFRDGTVEQSFPTDTEGFVPFDQVFPYGAWQVAEVDYSRFKPTGVTVTVDGGGDVSSPGPYQGLLNPQEGSPRTDTDNPPVLLEGFQSMPGMTSVFDWGKKPYQPGENGGIAGIVFYASTRGEDDPRLTVGDPWEPGLPGVKVRLYREVAREGGGTSLALVREVQTDSWDNATPTGCKGEDPGDPFVTQTLQGDAERCFDGIRNFEQVRPGVVFDGGYFFGDIQPGSYVVEVVPPPGYELYKEEDKNVDFGDAFATAPVAMMLPGGGMLAILPDLAMVAAAMGPEPGLAQPPCVGPLHEVPGQLSLFPGVDTYAPFAGAMRPLCNRKRVVLSDQSQAAADFHLFTSTPLAAQFQGLVTDDIATETNRAAPSYGDKWGPAFLPISMRDFKGKEIYRTYSDAFGLYNGMVPSTINANIPVPSGYSPAMHSVCLNDPGPIPGPGGTLILDPQRNPNYGIFCYTLMFMPRATTYLDTPMLPQSAFAAGFNSVDCAFSDQEPAISRVDGDGVGPLVSPGGTLTIQSQGVMSVPNPAYEGPLTTAGPPYNQPTIERDFGFGASGTVTLGGIELPAAGITWSDASITANVPGDLDPGSYQLVVTRADNGKSSVNAVTVTVGTETPIRVSPGPGAIQAAIDGALPGSLILVEPGQYDELVVMWKPVRLQGSGASTIINAVKNPPEKLDAWRQKVTQLINNGDVDLLPGQPAVFDLIGGGLLGTELGAGVTVLSKNDGSFLGSPSRIDGLMITGADGGGGIFVNGYAHNLQVSNNYVTGNSGVMHGGIRIGHPFLPQTGDGPFGYNTNLSIHHNAITLNGAQADNGVGGGLALCTGSDNYRVSHNYICGNFNLGDGGGIGHLGLSDNGVIESNQVLFNQTFNQGLNRSGAGVFIAGEAGAGGQLTLGSGDVTLDANLIQGNQAATGHGGGLRTQNVNGRDVELDTNNPDNWHRVLLTNNMIVNNVAGWSGGGISLQDTANAVILYNTIANNDSTATVGALFDAGTGSSIPQPAGISSERHSLGLDAAIPGQAQSRRNFSNPDLRYNIIWQNRSFTYDATTTPPRLLPILDQTGIGDCPAGASYWDLGVLDPGFELKPQFSILTNAAGNNISADPQFLTGYCNGARTLNVPGGGSTMMVMQEAAEGGNAVDVRFGPLTPMGNYHIAESSPAVNPCSGGQPVALGHDFDAEARPAEQKDWGADETAAPPRGQVSYSSGVFGGVRIGTTATLTITATVSNAPVTFVSSTDPALPFAKTADTCSGNTIPVGGTCTFTVTFTPTAGITYAGSFQVQHDALCSPQTINLSGSGTGGTVVFSSGAFGNVPIGTTATLTITATVPLSSIAPVSFTSSTNPLPPFAKIADNCAGTVVAAGGSCTFEVTYSPTSANTNNGSFLVYDDAVNTPQTVALNGRGVRGSVAFSSGAFGNVLIGTTASRTITVSVSDFPVTFTSSTDPASPFAKTGDTCSGTTVPVGGTCTFAATYAPSSNVADSGSFTVTDNANGSPQTVSLSGTGVRQVAFTGSTAGTTLTSTVSGGSLAFGNRNGFVFSTVTITVNGLSPAPVTFGTLAVSNTVGTAFSKGADTCSGATLAPGSTCTVVINFNGPQGNNARAGTLSAPHDGAFSPTPLVLNVSGS